MDAIAVSSMTISSETYDKLIEAVGQNVSLTREVDRLNTEALKASLKLQTLARHVSTLLDELEGAFDSDEGFASPEIAQDYIDAAKFAADNSGRINNRIRQVEKWLNEYLPC